MSNRKPIIAINTLAFHGYPLDTALEEIARLSDYVEPVFIKKYDPTLHEEYFNEDNARQLTKRLEQLGLKIMTMGSHMDLGQAEAEVVFKNRMEFAKTIITNAGQKSCQTTFYKNMDTLIFYAERIDLHIALKKPGDGQDFLFW
jgi:sugar phosphate isomerase/epimerase